MWIGEHFVYVRFPRTGGTWTKRVLEEIYGTDHVPGYQHYGTIPEEYQHLPRFIFIRAPKSWYESMYAIVAPKPDYDFAEFMRRNKGEYERFMTELVDSKTVTLPFFDLRAALKGYLKELNLLTSRASLIIDEMPEQNA